MFFEKMLNLKITVKAALVVTLVYALIFYLFIGTLFFRNGNKTKMDTLISMEYVVVHLDLKGAPPKLEYLKSVLPLLKKHGANSLLIEYEDMFPYKGKIEGINSKYCYNRTELLAFLKTAHGMGFQLIPLVQTFGHMEAVLKLQEYRKLREDDEFPDSICPSDPNSIKLIGEMVRQILDFHEMVAPVKFFHIGCDEVFHINSCLRCKARKLMTEEIFLHHAITVSEIIKKDRPNITLLIWDDMFMKINPTTLRTFEVHKYFEPVVWDYNPMVRKPYHIIFKYFSAFNNVWIASAFKGAKHETTILPDIANRYANHKSWFEFIAEYKEARRESNNFRGIILTGWSRYSHFAALCELLPVSIPSLVLNLMFINENLHRSKETLVFPVDINTQFVREMNCDDYIPTSRLESDIKDCNYSEKTIYHLFESLNKTEENVMKVSEHYNFYTSENLEYYINKNHVNPNRIQMIVDEMQKLKNVLKLVAQSLKDVMSIYYEQPVIEEYFQYKIGHLEKILTSIQDNMDKSKRVKYWNKTN